MAPTRKEVGRLITERLGTRQVNWLAEQTGIDRTALAAIRRGDAGVGLVRGKPLHAALGGKLSDYITDPRAYERVRREEEPSEDTAPADPEAALAAQARRFDVLEQRVDDLEQQLRDSDHGSDEP